MRELLLISSMLLISSYTYGHNLEGIWVGDFDKTVKFNAEHVKLSQSRLALMACSIKESQLRFDQGEAEFSLNSHTCELRGKRSEIAGDSSTFKYAILFNNGEQTVVSLDGERAQTINWVTPGLFWIDEGSEDELVRYFYKAAH